MQARTFSMFIIIACSWTATLTRTAFADGLPPAEAVKRFKLADGLEISLVASEPQVSQPLSISFDDRGRMWVLQYLQYPIPNGRTAVEVDQYLRTKYDKQPEPPPRGPKGRDRLSILEDTNGDGRADTLKHFVSDLNLASGFALGHRGVFIVQPPYLLFYPDRNGDDVPDCDPEVLLKGFGIDDAHAFANSLTWGPDGWLYGAQGSTVTASIRGIEFQQGIWRYHPRTKQFELFAEGGGNTWGIDFDRFGNLFAGGNTVEPLCHHVQGAYYVKGFGKHGPLHNPHTYGYFPPVKHYGYAGDSLTGGFVIYQGGAFPDRFNNQCIAPNGRHSAMRWSTLETRGSTFATRAAGDFITTSDIWFRPVDSTVGPDGALYVADWYDYNISHSSPKNRGKWYMPSRSDGRVWRVAPADVKPLRSGELNLSRRTSEQLVDLLSHANDWYARQARRVLAERRDASIIGRLTTMAYESEDQRLALQSLWSLYVSGGWTDAVAARMLDSQHEYVRAWTVRLLGDQGSISKKLQAQLTQLARFDPSNVVRSQLACSAKRLPAKQATGIVRELLRHDEDAGDPHVPLLLWWAIEAKALSDHQQILQLVESSDVWKLKLVRGTIVERLARRYAAEGTDAGFSACATLLCLAPDDEGVALILAGMVKALRGRRLHAVPAAFQSSLNRLLERQADDPKVIQLALRIGNASVHERALQIVADSQAELTARVALIETLAQTATNASIPTLLSLLDRPNPVALRSAALGALGYFDEGEIAYRVVNSYGSLSSQHRARAIELLSGRKSWSIKLLEAVAVKKIDPADVSLNVLRQMLRHQDKHIDRLIAEKWGRIQPATTHEIQGRITAISQVLARGRGDAVRGFKVFEKVCATCHKLHGKGNTIGPDITAAERKDRGKLVGNIVDPNALIRQQYIAHVVLTTDGRVMTGLLAESSPDTITLLDAKNNRTMLARDDIEVIKESRVSLMPERLLEPLSDQQIRDLFRYLQSEDAATP